MIYDYIIKRYGIDPETSIAKLQYSRGELAMLFKELGFNKGAEIGVDRGLFAEALSKLIPGIKLYCIDPWKVYHKYPCRLTQHKFNVHYNCTKKRLKPYNCEIIRKSSMNAIKDFAPGSLDFVYIDGNHNFDYVLEDLNEWSKVVKKGGIISGHDYKSTRKTQHLNIGVGEAVDIYIKEHNIKTLFLCRKFNDSSYFFVNED